MLSMPCPYSLPYPLLLYSVAAAAVVVIVTIKHFYENTKKYLLPPPYKRSGVEMVKKQGPNLPEHLLHVHARHPGNLVALLVLGREDLVRGAEETPALPLVPSHVGPDRVLTS